MPFKFFRPWEDDNEVISRQASTFPHGSAADVLEMDGQSQVYCGWASVPEERANPLVSPSTPMSSTGSMNVAVEASDVDKVSGCHSEYTAKKLWQDLDNAWTSTSSTVPRNGENIISLSCVVMKGNASLTDASQIIPKQNVTCTQESSRACDLLRSTARLSQLSKSLCVIDSHADGTPDETVKSEHNPLAVKNSGQATLENSLNISKGFLSIKCKEKEQTNLVSSPRPKQEYHRKSKTFTCSVCRKDFLRSTSLQVHKRIHSRSKTFQCEICEKTFTKSYKLLMHVRIHTGFKPFRCKFCKKFFSQSGYLQRHERIHTGSKPFQCKFCKKSFTQSGNLQNHERIHTGSKPFKCKFCKQGFTNSSNMHRHEQTHTGFKPFKCALCQKVFTRSSNLQVHERNHTGSKPFKCKTCDKMFITSSNLSRHEQIHSGFKPF